MKVQITARHCDVPADVLERADAQVAALSKYSPRATSADVVFVEEKLSRVIEVIVHIDGGEPVVARAEDGDFRGALDKVVDRMSRRLRKQRERRTDHQAPPLSEQVGGE
ncbi:MAG TPA: ribosome-associated translation inhibitor RaiA [Longimicrobiales bacterium]|nr:ribosome-associated translation inhibitor RaiA [Longimicrobiales bacterium]